MAHIPFPAWPLSSCHRTATPQVWYDSQNFLDLLQFHKPLSDCATGKVVRVSPNELSFATVESWKAIYGHRSGGAPTPIKGEFYDIYGAGFESLCIGSERNPQKHGQMRRMLSVAFATKSLVEQEDIITASVNDFVQRIGQDEVQPLNMTKWYEMVAFDTLGEMAFGQSFNSVKAGKLP
jgi:hypothetical protein